MKKIFKILTITLIILITTTYTNMGIAASKTDLQNEKDDLTDSITDAQNELKNIEKEKSNTLNEVEKLMGQISDYESEIDELNYQITDLQTKISDAEKQIKADEEEYQKQQGALNERLVTMYENGEISYLDVLLSSTSLIDFISSYYLVSELTTYDTEMLKQVEEEKNKIENEKKELENSKASLDTAKKSKETKANALQVVKKEKQEKANELSEEEKTTQKEIQEMLEDKAKIDKELQKIAEEEIARQKKAAEEAAKKNKGGSSSAFVPAAPSEPSKAGYIFPVQGCSKANINNKNYPSYSGHTGVDVNIGVVGKKVVAVKDGTVVTSTAMRNANGSYRSYGEYITISHGDGTMTVYAHMLAGSRTVTANQQVKQGQVIGTVGSTGNSTGTHLHFEVRVLSMSSGVPKYKVVNPLPYLP